MATDYVTVTATLLQADGSPEVGEVAFAPDPTCVWESTIITGAPVTGVIDGQGRIEVRLLPSDAAEWIATGPVPYRVSIHAIGEWSDHDVLVLGGGPLDLSQILLMDAPLGVVPLPVPGPPGPLGIDSVQATAHALAYGEEPTVSATITGMPGARVLTADLGVPAGPQGIQGPQGEQGIQGPRGEQGIQGVPGEVTAAQLAAVRDPITAASWWALPTSGNWVGRVARVEALGLWAYWDGVRWRVDPRSDTGWVPVTSWDTAGVVTGVPLGTSCAPSSGSAGGVWVRRTSDSLDIKVSRIQVTAGANTFVRLWAEPFSLPVGWRLPAGDYASSFLYAYGTGIAYLSFAESGHYPLIGGSANVSTAPGCVARFSAAGTPWPTSLVIS